MIPLKRLMGYIWKDYNSPDAAGSGRIWMSAITGVIASLFLHSDLYVYHTAAVGMDFYCYSIHWSAWAAFDLAMTGALSQIPA